MKKKLFDALQTKFQGVDAQILDRLATKKAEGQTDESQIPTIVEGLSFQDVLTSYGDFRAGDASFKAVSNYEKKHNLKEGKTIEAPGTPPTPSITPPAEEIPAWAQTLIDQGKSFNERLNQNDEAKALEQRNASILAKAKEYGIPDSFAKRYNVPADADLDEYFKDAKQELANLGFEGVKAPENPEARMQKQGESIAAAIDAQTKEIVEQKQK